MASANSENRSGSGRLERTLLLGIVLVVAALVAAPVVALAEGAGAARRAAEQTDVALIQARAAVAFLGLLVFAVGLWPRCQADPRLARARLVALCLLGLASYAGYYNWLTMSHTKGFARSDNFVYFVGSKYFDELGHDGLYECSLTALEARGLWPRIPNRLMRDPRTLEPVPEAEMRRAGLDCPERFGAERWQAFGDDVAWFARSWPPGYQYAVFHDYGYNATPGWIALGKIVTAVVDLESETAVWGLLHLDRLLVAATIACVGWAFGLEMAALLAIAWGGGLLWRYVYLGDSMLRFLWWNAAVLAVCALRRDRPALGGVALAVSSWLRFFPATMVLGVLAGDARRMWSERRLSEDMRRFVIGLGVAGLTIAGLALLLIEDGVGAFVSLMAKLSLFESLVLPNEMGLASLASWLLPQSPALSTALHWSVLAVFLALLWRALGRAEPWEAAALGCAAIPMLSTPPSYYLVSITIPLLLAASRPRIGVSSLLAIVLLNLNGVTHYRQATEFGPATLVVVLLCLHAVAEVAFARPVAARSDAA